ncbi:hypothetical protein V2J09_014145 [Rumex salicifolius]
MAILQRLYLGLPARRIRRMVGIDRSRLEAILLTFVSVRTHEISTLLHSSSCFFFILSAYFVLLPLRDEGALSLGLSTLPTLFIGSLLLTLIAAPISTLVFSLPNLSRRKALVFIHRFFSLSLIAFFILWHSSSAGFMPLNVKDSVSALQEINDQAKAANTEDWDKHSWFYIAVRIGFFLWIALLNLITISSTWARVIDVMDNESGSRLFGFIGAGATLGQLFGSLFATGMAWMGSFLLLFAAFLMELAAQSSKGIDQDGFLASEEQSPLNKPEPDHQDGAASSLKRSSPKPSTYRAWPQVWVMLDGLRLILSSSYLLYVSLHLWLSAVVSSFFYFQKVTIISMTTSSAVGRRKLFGQINSFIAIFIFAGQMTLTGRILAGAGVTVAICSAPSSALLNLVAIAVWPTWISVAITETMRKVITYVVARPGRELLFTVVSQEEKYKAKVCIDVIVQRLGDATAAGMFKILFGSLHAKPSTVSLYALPVCFVWIATALHLGRRQEQLVKIEAHNESPHEHHHKDDQR